MREASDARLSPGLQQVKPGDRCDTNWFPGCRNRLEGSGRGRSTFLWVPCHGVNSKLGLVSSVSRPWASMGLHGSSGIPGGKEICDWLTCTAPEVFQDLNVRSIPVGYPGDGPSSGHWLPLLAREEPQGYTVFAPGSSLQEARFRPVCGRGGRKKTGGVLQVVLEYSGAMAFRRSYKGRMVLKKLLA